MQHTFFSSFLFRCFACLQLKTPRNFLVTCFLEEMSSVFLLPFFSLPLTFILAAASIFHFLTAPTKFSCCSSNKKMSPLLFSLPLALCCSFSRRASLVCRLLFLFVCLSLSLFSIYVDRTINLSLIL